MNTTVVLATGLGLLLSFATLALLRPALSAPWRWQWRGVGLHCALWLAAHALLVGVLGRPWFAMALCLAFLMLLIQVSNAKYHALREPFVFQDFEYFTDAIRHPRLYIPFLGWWKFATVAIAVVAALAVGLGVESHSDGLLLTVAVLFFIACVLLVISSGGETPSFLPDDDIDRMGFLGSLFQYAVAERVPLDLSGLLPGLSEPVGELPDVLVVQSESFFDARRLFSGIRSGVLAKFDGVLAEALCHGRLAVPAWGANTVRSEFAFLTSAPESLLGVHRFNPYRQILKGKVTSLAQVLKAAGYRTICLHPYPASFYARDKVYPYLGFDEFIDIREFKGAERCGPYVSDAAVTENVKSLFQQTEGPVFIFVITMENHGPLHLEAANPEDVTSLYDNPPPDNCEDLTVYLRHLRNADRMIGEMRDFLLTHPRAVRFCWYGDHVPIMGKVYHELGVPDGLSEYFLWSNRTTGHSTASAISLSGLAQILVSTIRDP